MTAPATIKVTDEMRQALAEQRARLLQQVRDEYAGRAHSHEWDASKQAISDEDRPAAGAKQ